MLPAAASLRRQGAGRGATASFLVSTPETGVDSLAVTYALLDPIMTIARPLAALVTAIATGLGMNLLPREKSAALPTAPDLSCPVDACCDGVDCPPEEHKQHHSRWQKLRSGLVYALGELWDDLAGWFLLGVLLAALIGALVPAELMTRYLGGGIGSMLIMLCVGIPLYICASASTPIAAALILKGVSPGAALVFLLAGPATNVTSLTVLVGVLGKRGTALYLAGIAVGAVLCGLAVDQVYALLKVNPVAVVGSAKELVPEWLRWAGAMVLMAMSIRPLYKLARAKLAPKPEPAPPAVQSLDSLAPGGCGSSGCGCGKH
ncbi:MAG: SO_0444 family Cu/Zn efflux transporter [Desulfarculaceae bacterium]|nr:SO_0444 family Cu/Zn efflux transporter [Desulfarculaceae bacterium]